MFSIHFSPEANVSFVEEWLASTSARNLLSGQVLQVLFLNCTIIKRDVVEEKNITRRYIQKNIQKLLTNQNSRNFWWINALSCFCMTLSTIKFWTSKHMQLVNLT